MADKNLRLNMIMSMVDKLTTPAQKVTKQTDAMATKIKATQQELTRLGATNKDIEHFRELKKHASATEQALDTAKKQTAALGVQLKNTANPTRKMTREFEKATAEVRRLESVQQKERQELQAMRTTLDKAGVSTRNLSKATRDIQTQSTRYTQQLTKQRNELEAVTARQAKLNKITDRNKNIRSNAMGDAIGVGAALYAAERLTAAYGDVANAQGEIGSLGVSSKGIDAITKSARDFSNQWAGTTQADFIRASYDIKSGISTLGDEAVGEFTRIAALTAGATKSATGEMTSLFASGYGIYRKQFDQFAAGTIEGWNQLSAEERDIKFGEYFSAGIASSVKAFKTDGQQMSAAISNLGAAATSANVPFAEQLSILGQLQATMGGSEAATKYRAFLSSAAKASDELGLSFTDANNNLRDMPDILEQLRDKYGDTIDAVEEQELKKAFGTDEAIGLIKLLYPEVDQLRQNIDGMNGSLSKGTAVTEDMAKTILKGPGQALPLMMQQISNMTVAIGGLLAPAMMGIAGFAGDAAMAISSFTEQFPLLSKMLGFAVVGLVGLKAASVVSRVAFSLFSDAMVFGSKVTALFNLTTLKSNALLAVSRVRALAVTSGIVAMAAAQKAVAASTAVMTAAQWAFNVALSANPIGLVIVAIMGLVAAAALVIKHWDSVKGFFAGLWDSVTNTFSQAWGHFKEILSYTPLGWLMSGWSGVTDFFAGIWQSVKSTVTSFFAWVEDIIGFNPLTVITEAWSGIFDFFGGLFGGIKSSLGGVTKWLTDTLLNPISAIKDTLGGVWDSLFGEDKDVKVNSQVKAVTAPAVAAVPSLTNPQATATGDDMAAPASVPGPRAAATGLVTPGGQSSVQYTYTYGDIVVQAQPGDSAQDIAEEVRRQLQSRERATQQRTRGRLGD